VTGPQLADDDQGSSIGATLAQFPAVLWQRRWFIAIPALIGLIGAVAAAWFLPARYESAAILLVQSPSLPPDIVGPEADDAIDRRIEAIRQQIINRPALVGLIETNQLYPKDRGKKPLSELVEKMRDAIVLAPEQAELATSKPEDRTISVRLAFTYEKPDKAQAITQQLMERVVEVNSTTNTAQKTQAVQFLSDQGDDLQRQIAEVQGQISQINARYGGVMAAGSAPIISGGGGTYDMQIAALERENASIQSQQQNLTSADTRDPAVVNAEAQLAALRSIYAESHPDVVIAKQRLEEARRFATQNVQRLPTDTLARQIAFNNTQIAALRAAKSRDSAQVMAAVNERSQIPMVQQQAAQAQQKLDGLYKQFEGVSARPMAARAGARANDQQMGERLLVVDPPVVPDKPSWPNRPLIFALGFGGGLGLGFILAMAVELFLQPIRDPRMISAITGARPLAMVPMIGSNQKKRKSSGRSWRWPKVFRKKAVAVEQGYE
jgi:polysaccharide biosynthesis transport protein